MKTNCSSISARIAAHAALCISTLLLTTCNVESIKSAKEDAGPCYSEAAVVTAHPLATEVGIEVLRKGGNAFDAAIAVQFALAVVYPRAGNIGGGGFMVFQSAEGQNGSLDFRETAPLLAHRDMYLDDQRNVIPLASTLGHLSVGVPGVVDGMWRIHQKFGSQPWENLLKPAIKLAEKGFALTEAEASKINSYRSAFLKVNSEDMPLLSPDSLWSPGDSVFLPQLAECLRRIEEDGRNGFYNGVTAELLLKEIQSGGGIIRQEDLDGYTSRWMDVIREDYRGYEVLSMPPPSSGGIALAQLLKGAEKYDISNMGAGTVQTIHLMAELERRVYADRATHLGDPEFWPVPEDILLSDNYLSDRNSSIDLSKKTNSQEIKEGKVEVIESVETTHFSILDQKGNAVAITTTLNGNFGSKVMVDGAQFFLNNEMDDFSVKPGVPNMYGLVGGEANAIAPEKRMLSSMTPTIVLKDGDVFLILGTPGGSTIITSVFQIILNTIDHKMDLERSVASPRWHHQWLPDRIIYEEDLAEAPVLEGLRSLGHELESRRSIGRIDAIHIPKKGCIRAVGDLRGDDVAAGF